MLLYLGARCCGGSPAEVLERLKRRAAKAGLLDRLDIRTASPESMGIADLKGSVDFVLAFAVVHEIGDARHFFAEVASVAKPGALLLFAEPKGHVKEPGFDAELRAAADAGFDIVDRPPIRRSRSALLKKS